MNDRNQTRGKERPQCVSRPDRRRVIAPSGLGGFYAARAFSHLRGEPQAANSDLSPTTERICFARPKFSHDVQAFGPDIATPLEALSPWAIWI